jgi:hypothetical protein
MATSALAATSIPGRFCIRKRNGHWEFRGDPCYETRRASVEQLIQEGDALFPTPDFDDWMWIWTSDRPEVCPVSTDLFFSTPSNDRPLHPAHKLPSWVNDSKTKSRQILVPDFVFGNWPQVGIHDFDQVCRTMTESGKQMARLDKCGWIGNASLTRIRLELVRLGEHYPQELDIVNTGTWKKPADPLQTRLSVSKNQYKSLPDLVADYSMLIDIEGYGWSGRLKLLLHSNRPLFIQERPWSEFYFEALVPWKHYIPVHRNLDDLIDKVRWVKTNREEAQLIASNALEFAQTHLTRQAAVIRWGLQLSCLPTPLTLSTVVTRPLNSSDSRTSVTTPPPQAASSTLEPSSLSAQYVSRWRCCMIQLFTLSILVLSRYVRS